MQERNKKWVFLIILSLIWGSSFLLMKRGLEEFTPLQVGALRVGIAATTLIIVGFKHLKIFTKQNFWHLFFIGLFGNFLPGFLFAIAQTQLDSGLTGVLNSMVPLFTLVIGIYLFKFPLKNNHIIGIVIGLIGALMLILKGAEISADTDFSYAIFVIIASISYAINSNLVKKYMSNQKALAITVSSFSLFLIPAILVLLFTGFFSSYKFQSEQNIALSYVAFLAIIGTALAVSMFNHLIKISSPVFATSVTYIVPIIAIFWAILDGETLHWMQLLGAVIILSGVYLVNKK